MIVLTLEQEAAVREACEDAGIDFRPTYSGRGMYGDTCIGLVVQGNSHAATLTLIETLGLDVVNEFTSSCSDSMGRDIIIYYPGVKTQAGHLAKVKGQD